VFTDGWAPNITEPELIGIASESEQEEDQVPIHVHREEAIIRNRRDVNSREYQRGPHYDDSDIDDNHIDNRHIQHRGIVYKQSQREAVHILSNSNENIN
jgi:hypothetical protein